MIEVKYGGVTLICGTAQEAVEVAKALAGSTASATTKIAPRKRAITAPWHREYDEFLIALSELPNGQVDTERLARVLGVKSIQGLGPRLVGLNASFAKLHPPRRVEEFITKEGASGAPLTWSIDRLAVDRALTEGAN
jgi:hypothetical protein